MKEEVIWLLTNEATIFYFFFFFSSSFILKVFEYAGSLDILKCLVAT